MYSNWCLQATTGAGAHTISLWRVDLLENWYGATWLRNAQKSLWVRLNAGQIAALWSTGSWAQFSEASDQQMNFVLELFMCGSVVLLSSLCFFSSVAIVLQLCWARHEPWLTWLSWLSCSSECGMPGVSRFAQWPHPVTLWLSHSGETSPPCSHWIRQVERWALPKAPTVLRNHKGGRSILEKKVKQ